MKVLVFLCGLVALAMASPMDLDPEQQSILIQRLGDILMKMKLRTAMQQLAQRDELDEHIRNQLCVGEIADKVLKMNFKF